MATITGFNLTINALCEPHQKTCFLAYTYNVVWDDKEPEAGDFSVKAYLWGGDSFYHCSIIADNTNDAHKINRGTSMPVTRKIPVRCERLDKFWGEAIIMKLVVIPDSNENIRYEAIASTEMEQELATALLGPEEPKADSEAA
ncbi:MAG: hypothetical protein L0Y38_07910 [Methylococcaceae bacterium]|nr:hypothetical protein [Methylococcaceae bacterium]MCI0733730.1 hypothetical protein [Methylococcaceae bacterium]